MKANDPDIQRWADEVIREWDRKAIELGIHEGHLLNSFANHVVWAAGGRVDRIEFLFEYYGKFVDMGVGKGVSMEDRDALVALGIRRRPKPWFSSVFYRRVKYLKHLMAESTAQQTVNVVVRNVKT